MRRIIAALAMSMLFTTGTAAANPRFLSIKHARVAMSRPYVTVTHDCKRKRRNIVGCLNEWEGAMEIEPGSGSHAEAFVWAALCGHRVYQVIGGAPDSCRAAIADQHDHLAP